MNKQLALLDNIDELTVPSRKAQRTSKSKHIDHEIHRNSNPWWKLSPEEKAIGKQGIRAIRAILDSFPENQDQNYAKAS